MDDAEAHCLCCAHEPLWNKVYGVGERETWKKACAVKRREPGFGADLGPSSDYKHENCLGRRIQGFCSKCISLQVSRR